MSGCGGNSRRGCRGRRGCLRCRVIRIVEDARAGLAVKKFLVFGALQLLDHVRPDMHAALSAAFTANFRERNTTVPLGDALVVVDQILRNSCNSTGAHSLS